MDVQTPNPHVFRFGVFQLDTQSGELRRHGLKIRLPDQSFQILKTLLGRPGEVVTRDELRRVLWTSETFVDFEVGLNSAVRKLREALDDSAENPRFIETLPRRGYRFVGSITTLVEDPAPPLALVSEQTTVPVSGPALEHTLVATSEPPQPTRIRSRLASWRGATLLLVVVLCGAGVAYRSAGWADVRDPRVAEPIRSLVVLPFENLTGDASQDYIVDNITDAVTSHLAILDSLDVISRTSARQYKQSAKHLPEIGTELKVDGVVEG